MYDQGLHFTALGLFMLNPSAEYVVLYSCPSHLSVWRFVGRVVAESSRHGYHIPRVMGLG